MNSHEQQLPRIFWLDPLRFIAAFSVMFYHFAFRGYAASHTSTIYYPSLTWIAKYGFLGVDLFFLISGFVILMTAERTPTARAFCISRAIRLYPAFLVCCTITFAAKSILNNNDITIYQYLINMTLLGGLIDVPLVAGVYWSLMIELKFYILMTLIIYFVGTKHIEKIYWGWLLTLIATSVLGWPLLRVIVIAGFAHYFIAGGALYLIYRHGISISRVGLLGASGSWVLWSVYGQTLKLEQRFSQPFNPWITGTIAASFFIVFLAMFYLQKNPKNTLPPKNSGPLALLGAITYPLYLLHEDLGYMSINWLHNKLNDYIILIVAMLSMILLSYVIHKIIEKPSMSFLKRLHS